MVPAGRETRIHAHRRSTVGVDRVEAADWWDRQMHGERKLPVLITAFVAVVGTAVIVFNDFSPDNDRQDRAYAKMITAAAVSRAGAIEIPSASPDGQHSRRG
jgi:hypothetical protein